MNDDEWVEMPDEAGWYWVKHQHMPSEGTPCYVDPIRRTYGFYLNGWKERDYLGSDLAFLKIPACPTQAWVLPR
jgi:hypothetical protein